MIQWAAPLLCLLLFSLEAHGGENSPLIQLGKLPRASLLALDGDSRKIADIASDQAQIPASTLKVLTAWLAVKHWGPEHRFHTDFYIDDKRYLWVKGYGDPFLISEEIGLIAEALFQRGLASIRGIRLDSSFFSPAIAVDGQSSSNNPYDAPPGALAANFNTLYLQRTPAGIKSAEAQTPLTPVAKTLGTTLKVNGKIRINIRDSHLGVRYFGELLAAKLGSRGVQIDGAITPGTLPAGSQLYYRHYNSHTLEQILRAMLLYSTNFIANQLFLKLGADYQGPPATLDKARQFANQRITSRFNWEGVVIQEGAGLSRKNRITAAQFIELLQEFLPWRKLLPSEVNGIYAKTGTLRNISCYAGYIDSSHGPAPFALFVNGPAPPDFRLRVARELKQLIGTTSHQAPFYGVK